MQKIIQKALLICLFFVTLHQTSLAQFRPGFRSRVIVRPSRTYVNNNRSKPIEDNFKPSIHFSIGYGFPNVDKTYLGQYYHTAMGSIKQNGPIAASIDYQFNRLMSVGLLVTHGTVTAPYYDFSNMNTPAFTAQLSNWSYMLNLMRYLPGNKTVKPYIRTALGVNSWQQDYTDVNGNKASVQPANLPDFAYQVSIGTKIYLSKNTALQLEAGYGKYIIQGGLSIKL